MAEVDWATNDSITETKLDAMVDQLIINDTTAPTSPPEGMHWYDTSTGLLKRYDGSAWKAYPMGLIDIATPVATGSGYAIGASTVDVNGSPITADLQSGQNYRYSGNQIIASSADDTTFSFTCQLDGVDIDIQRDVLCKTAGFVYPISWSIIFTASTASHTAKMRVNRGAGAGLGGEKPGPRRRTARGPHLDEDGAVRGRHGLPCARRAATLAGRRRGLAPACLLATFTTPFRVRGTLPPR